MSRKDAPKLTYADLPERMPEEIAGSCASPVTPSTCS